MENYATKNTDVFLSARRFPEYEEIGICRREPFQRDRDRIMHSISDHIAGMTDQYAARTFTLLTMPEYV